MDRNYIVEKGISYANTYANEKPKYATMKGEFSGAAYSNEAFEMSEGPTGRLTSTRKGEEANGIENGTSGKRIFFAIVVFLMIAAVIALVVLGVIFLPKPEPPKEEEPTPFCDNTITASVETTGASNCGAIKSEVASQIRQVKLFSTGHILRHTKALTLGSDTSVSMGGIWTISWSATIFKFTVQTVEQNMTCNAGGGYSFEYTDDSGAVVYYQNLTLTYLGNLQDARINAIPYLKADGVSKAIYLTCSMKTGCQHGTIVPEFKTGNDVKFISQAACTSKFNKSEGGEVVCSTDIDEDEWNSVDEVICSLKPDNGVHDKVNKAVIRPGQTPLTDSCTLASFAIGRSETLNCKKKISGDVDIVLERKGFYFGNWTTLLDVSSQGSAKALNNRLTLTVVKTADLLDINITISEVHCSDRGNLALNYSDGSRTLISVDVTGIQESCSSSRSYEVDASRSFQLICAWCTGHGVTDVKVDQKEELSSTSSYPLFPINIFLLTDNQYRQGNILVKFSQEYGVMTVDIIRQSSVGCDYGDYYVITLSSLEGSSEKIVNVSITVPTSLYEYTFFDVPLINEQETELTFEGFLGCSPTSIDIYQDNKPVFTSEVVENDDDISGAQKFEVTWKWNPVTIAQNNTLITANVTFLAKGESTKRTYVVARRLNVLDSSLCDLRAGCNVPHPNDGTKFISCSGAGLISSITSCPAGLTLQFPTEQCSGQCS